MWTCPKCGREFGRRNQGHFCGAAPATVEAYIAEQAEEARPHLRALREVILGGVPEVRERIAWSMPTYEKGGGSLAFAAGKSRLSLYVGAEAVGRFQSELAASGLAARKSAVYLPYEREFPTGLISEIVSWCLE